LKKEKSTANPAGSPGFRVFTFQLETVHF